MVGVVFDGYAAAGGGSYDGFDAVGQPGYPGFDVAAHVVQAVCFCAVVQVYGSAAAGKMGIVGLDAEPIQYAGGGAVDVGREGGLDATFEHEDLARVFVVGHEACFPQGQDFVFECVGQQGTAVLSDAVKGGEELRGGNQLPQYAALEFLPQRSFDAAFGFVAADFGQFAVFDFGGADAFAGAAGEAVVEIAVQVAGGGCFVFQQLFDLVDAAAGAVSFVAAEAVSGADGVADAAVDAAADDFVGRLAFGRVADGVGKVGLHGLLSGNRVLCGGVEAV